MASHFGNVLRLRQCHLAGAVVSSGFGLELKCKVFEGNILLNVDFLGLFAASVSKLLHEKFLSGDGRDGEEIFAEVGNMEDGESFAGDFLVGDDDNFTAFGVELTGQAEHAIKGFSPRQKDDGPVVEVG